MGALKTGVSTGELNKRLITTNIAHLIGSPEYRKLKSELTELETIQGLDNSSILIRFSYPQMSSEVKVYRVLAFDHWTNFTTQPTYVTYGGPQFLMHNSTSNCTKGIDTPDTNSVYDRCATTNYVDSRLQMWHAKEVPANETTTEIKQLTNYNYVYCTYSSIEVEEEEIRCPPFVMRFPITQRFEAGGFEHKVKTTRLNLTSEVIPARTKHFNLSIKC